MADVGNAPILNESNISDAEFIVPSNTVLNPDSFFHGSWGNGITMFRGNPSRTWYGDSMIPRDPRVLWRYPENPMCADSTDKDITKK